MSMHDDLTSVQRRLDDLMRCVARLDEHAGDSIDMRRVRTDATRTVDMVTVPDTPYDRGLWADAEDEGLGSPHRHAP
jgi:hypothetical protein